MDWLATILDVGSSAASGGLVGMLLGLAPAVIKLFQAKADRAHEIAMRTLDWEIAKSGSEQRIREADAAGYWDVEGKQMEALREALTAQGRMTGIPFIDAVNQSVRPFVTYWMMALWTLTKFAIFIFAGLNKNVGWENALALLWSYAEMQMLCGILGFWFVNRELAKNARGV